MGIPMIFPIHKNPIRLSYALVAGRWHRYSPSHRSGHSFRSAGGFACFSVKHLSDPCWKCLTFSLKNLKNLLVDFYLCFRLPWWVQFWRFLFSGCIWHRCFNILRITQRIKHARKHLWDWVHRKLEKKSKNHVVSSCPDFLIAFDSCHFSRQKTDRTHICPPEICLSCVCTHIHTAGFTTYFSKPIRIHFYDLILNHSQSA